MFQDVIYERILTLLIIMVVAAAASLFVYRLLPSTQIKMQGVLSNFKVDAAGGICFFVLFIFLSLYIWQVPQGVVEHRRYTITANVHLPGLDRASYDPRYFDFYLEPRPRRADHDLDEENIATVRFEVTLPRAQDEPDLQDYDKIMIGYAGYIAKAIPIKPNADGTPAISVDKGSDTISVREPVKLRREMFVEADIQTLEATTEVPIDEATDASND